MTAFFVGLSGRDCLGRNCRSDGIAALVMFSSAMFFSIVLFARLQ